MTKSVGLVIAALVVGGAMLAEPVWGQPAPAAGGAPLGSAGFKPTPENPIGWRGDWTGRFSGATPPVMWERKRSGSGYLAKNILWSVKLPDKSVASPIVVGDKIFICSEPWDVVCLDKKTGNILWIRSCTEYEGLSAEEKAGYPDLAGVVDPLLPQLAAANDAAVKALNAAISPLGVSDDQRAAIDDVLKQKRDIQNRIYEALKTADKKKFERYWAQAVFGFAGQTPCSDGKQVYVFFATGVTAGFDLDGNRKWLALGKGTCSEHGNFASPLVMGGKVMVWAAQIRAYDAATGKLGWTTPAESGNTYGTLFPIKLKDGVEVAAFQSGWFTTVKDGQAIWGKYRFGDATPTPVVEDGLIFTNVGYPRNAEGLGFKSYKIPDSADGKLDVAVKFDTTWGGGELGNDKAFEKGTVASPLYVDGLLYQLTEGGGLMVNDAQTGQQVYRKVLEMKPKTNYWMWAGASASPTLAGKHIYLMDNQGLTIVIEPGREYKEVGRNMLENLAGNEQEQNLTNPWFEAKNMFYRSPEYMYCIGEK